MGGLRSLFLPLKIGLLQKFSWIVERYIRDRRLREMVYQYATYSGASPFRAPATLAVIPYAEFGFGGWYIEGGMYRLAEEMLALARRLGVESHVGCGVRRILIEPAHAHGRRRKSSRAIGVEMDDGRVLKADVIVANSDVVHTYRRMIDAAHRPHWTDRKLDSIDPGGSGMVLLLGVEGTYPQLAHHTKFMPHNYRDDLDSMFERREIPRDPCIYVCASTRTDPTQAPDGCENLFILASAPALDGRTAWASEGPRYRDLLVRKLQNECGLERLDQRIVVEERLTPLDMQSLYNANAGGIYGVSSNGVRSAFLRPPNRDRRIERLYFCGGGTHPGGGLPLVALSGKIVSELVAEDLSC